MINDILHEKINDKWEMKVSSYPKLRLPVNEVLNKLEENGLKAVLSTVVQGMNYIIAEKN
jgi:hypothetical protein